MPPETVEVTTDTGGVVDAVAEQVAGIDPAEGESQQADVIVDAVSEPVGVRLATEEEAIKSLLDANAAWAVEDWMTDARYATNGKDFVAADGTFGRLEDGIVTYYSTEPRPGAIYPQ